MPSRGNQPKVISGARAILKIAKPDKDGNVTTDTVGIFTNVSYNAALGAQPIYLLGRFTPAEIEYTHAEPVSLQLQGWRVWNHGPHADGNVPNVKDLLTSEYATLEIHDRLNCKEGVPPIAKVEQLRVTGHSVSISSRQLTEMTITAVGIMVTDESNSGDQEPQYSMDLPV